MLHLHPAQLKKNIQHSFLTRAVEGMFSLPVEVLVLLAILNIFFFCGIFFALSFIPSFHSLLSDGAWWDRFVASLYFSSSLASNTGVGDLGTINTYKILGSIEMVVSIFLFAFVIAKITSKKSEELMENLYEMQVDTNFRNLREDLYIVRRRFDAITLRTKQGGALAPEDLSLFMLSVLELNSCLMQSPQILLNIGHSSELDKNRQELIIAMIHRTIVRMHNTVRNIAESAPAYPKAAIATTLERFLEAHKKYHDTAQQSRLKFKQTTLANILETKGVTERIAQFCES
jgi:hypothetical protein